MESGSSDSAGEATGIGANSCRFRIEWLCPLDIALEHVHVGAARMCKAGFIHEYMTLIEVGQTDVSWHQMHDWGPFPPR